jgi:hypothetical protein
MNDLFYIDKMDQMVKPVITKRIQKELKEVENYPIEGIAIVPIFADRVQLSAWISGH